MPYIEKSRRTEIETDMFEGGTFPVLRNPGDLNYVISMILKNYLHDNGERYQTYNDMIGALEGAKLELYRQQVAPYEDDKISTNGAL